VQLRQQRSHHQLECAAGVYAGRFFSDSFKALIKQSSLKIQAALKTPEPHTVPL